MTLWITRLFAPCSRQTPGLFLRTLSVAVGSRRTTFCVTKLLQDVISLRNSAAIIRRPFSISSGSAPVVAMGTRVTLTYRATLDDGLVFDDGLEPVTFVCGEGAMVAGFHKGIIGMSVGEIRELNVEPIDGFGEWNKNLVVKAPIGKMPDSCKIGTKLSLGKGQGDATIVALTDEYAMLDRNHPLAGKRVKFTVSLISCEEIPKQERVVVETISPGDGATYPKPGDNLTMHYVGKLSGSDAVFDSSRARGEPLTFTIGVKQVIEGWDEGVIRMSLGERAVLKIPSAKAYGSKGAGGGLIPPNADLTFEVELLKIN